MGEKEEEKKGHLWRDSSRSEADGERAGGGELRRLAAVASDGGASVANLRRKTAERVHLGERLLDAMLVCPGDRRRRRISKRGGDGVGSRRRHEQGEARAAEARQGLGLECGL
jgi:hypothetical protein